MPLSNIEMIGKGAVSCDLLSHWSRAGSKGYQITACWPATKECKVGRPAAPCSYRSTIEQGRLGVGGWIGRVVGEGEGGGLLKHQYVNWMLWSVVGFISMKTILFFLSNWCCALFLNSSVCWVIWSIFLFSAGMIEEARELQKLEVPQVRWFDIQDPFHFQQQLHVVILWAQDTFFLKNTNGMPPFHLHIFLN